MLGFLISKLAGEFYGNSRRFYFPQLVLIFFSQIIVLYIEQIAAETPFGILGAAFLFLCLHVPIAISFLVLLYQNDFSDAFKNKSSMLLTRSLLLLSSLLMLVYPFVKKDVSLFLNNMFV